MSQERVLDRDVHIRARHIGGIEETEVELSPGVTVLTGRNASNRTSFLQAIMAGFGSDRATLKGDAAEGEVELRIGEETYTRTLTRSGDTVTYGGDPYLDDPTLADRFAFLLEGTEARRAVARGEDLRDIITEPLDTAQIEAEIDRLEATKRDLDDELAELDRLERELPDLTAERRAIEDDLEEARSELAAVESEIEDHDLRIDRDRSRGERADATLDELREARAALEDAEFELETERQTLEELQDERESLESQLDEMAVPEEDPERLEGRIEELRDRKRSLDETVSRLGNVIEFNKELLAGDGLDVADPDERPSGGDPTERLLGGDETTVCWTCGSEVERERIEATVDRLRDIRATKLDERGDLADRIDELSSTRSDVQQRRRERERVEARLSETTAEIESTRERIDSLEASLADRREEVDRLEAATEELEPDEGYQELLDLQVRSTEIERRVDRLTEELADVEERIADRETAIEERADLVDRREEVNRELVDLRTRVERTEEEAVEQFNDHMDAVLGVLAYDNIERIWIERRRERASDDRRSVDGTTFDLHIVRSTEDGTTYEDTVDHLSESERKVTGLVFALSGYLVYDVHEELPFMLLDSLEAIDADRIARVVDYFSDYADYLTVALLPEDAAALDEAYTYVERFA